jgi:DNA-binding MarR family transcriptional regulator
MGKFKPGEADIEELNKLWHLMYRKMLAKPITKDYWHIEKVSSLELSVLGTLWRNPEMAPKDIADSLSLSRSTIASALNRLETRGYLERRISPTDRRSFLLVLTNEGELAQKEHIESERVFYAKMLSLFDSKRESANFLILIRKIVEKY